MKKITAVTVNYNRPESTKKLLDSMGALHVEGFDLEVIVVDNGTKEEFRLEKKNEKISVIRPGENTGFSKGNNIGIKEALVKNADFVLLINNDTVTDKNLVKKLVEVLEKNPDAGIVSPKIYFEKGKEFHKSRYDKNDLGKVIWYAGGFMDWENAKSVHRGVDEVDHGQYDRARKIDFATGCCMLIKKEVFEEIGYFDEKYFLYYEDADFSVRAGKAGFSIIYEPEAFLYHENASSSGSGSSLHDYFLTRNQMIFGMKYAPFRTKLNLVKQSINLFFTGRPYQKRGVKDYFLRKFGKGTYFDKRDE